MQQQQYFFYNPTTHNHLNHYTTHLLLVAMKACLAVREASGTWQHQTLGTPALFALLKTLEDPLPLGQTTDDAGIPGFARR